MIHLLNKTRSRPQETVEFKQNKQMETFSFNPPINLSEEGKGLFAVTSFEATTYAFIITDENNSFLITIPSHWSSQFAEKSIHKLDKILELRSQINKKLHVEQVGKKRKIIFK